MQTSKLMDTRMALNVSAAIVATHAAADAELRELRLLTRCGDLMAVDAEILAAGVTGYADRRSARLAAVRHEGQATTLDTALWGGDLDGFDAAVRRDLAAAELL